MRGIPERFSRDAFVTSRQTSEFNLRLNPDLSISISDSIVACTMAHQILRGQLRSLPANGHTAFLPQIRKVVVEFCQHYPSSRSTRCFVAAHLERVARQNPHVEFVVKQRNGQQPIARGFYGG